MPDSELVKQNCTSQKPQNQSEAFRIEDDNEVFDNYFKFKRFSPHLVDGTSETPLQHVFNCGHTTF